MILSAFLLMLASSFLIHYVENMEKGNLIDNENSNAYLDVMWWCLKVITTVGDNIQGPKTTIGQLIGGTCALLGVIIFSLPIPIVINSFSTFYNNLLWIDQIQNRKKLLAKKLGIQSDTHMSNNDV